MKRRVLRDAEKRAKKKEIRKQNIKKGSESPCLCRDEAQHLIRGGSEALRTGLPRIQRSHGFRYIPLSASIPIRFRLKHNLLRQPSHRRLPNLPRPYVIPLRHHPRAG